MSIREKVYSDKFYPDNPQVLYEMILSLSISSKDMCADYDTKNSRILISPHASYIYSGNIAAGGYKIFSKNQNIDKVIVIGPSHNVPFHGFGFSSFDQFETPLGPLDVDKELQDEIFSLVKSNYSDLSEEISIQDEAHKIDHSIEVQLPFIQSILNIDKFLPIIAGMPPNYDKWGEIFSYLLNKYENLGIVVSTDLSHFLSYDEAVEKDNNTIEKIKNLYSGDIVSEEACGFVGINTSLSISQKMNYDFLKTCYINSGNTAVGTKGSVVGYLSGVFN